MVRPPHPGAGLRDPRRCGSRQIGRRRSWPAVRADPGIAGCDGRSADTSVSPDALRRQRIWGIVIANDPSAPDAAVTSCRLRNLLDCKLRGVPVFNEARLLRTAPGTHRSRQRPAPTGCCSPMGSPMARFRNALKRGFDICVSLCLLLLTLPLMLLTATADPARQPGTGPVSPEPRRPAWQVVHPAQVPQHGDGRRGWRQPTLGDPAGPAHHPRRQLHPAHADRRTAAAAQRAARRNEHDRPAPGTAAVRRATRPHHSVLSRTQLRQARASPAGHR